MKSDPRVKVATTSVLIVLVLIVIWSAIARRASFWMQVREFSQDPNFQGYTILPHRFIDWELQPGGSGDTSLDDETKGFFNSHNAPRMKMAKISLDANSVWPGYYSEDKVWRLHFECDWENGAISVEGGGQKATIAGNLLATYAKEYYGSMHVNLLHMIAFAVFNPREFAPAGERELIRPDTNGKETRVPVKVVTSRQGVELCFQKATGRLVRLTAPLPGMGEFTLDMDEYVVVDPVTGIALPMCIRTRAPDDAFSIGLPLRFDRVMHLQIDPKTVGITYRQESPSTPAEHAEPGQSSPGATDGPGNTVPDIPAADNRETHEGQALVPLREELQT